MSRLAVKVEHMPTISTEKMVTSAEMEAMLRMLPVTWNRIKLDDDFFFGPDWNDWAKIIEYEKPRVPPYRARKFDCDNQADWFKTHVADDFEQNTCARVDGWVWVLQGNLLVRKRHAWCVFYESTAGVFYQLETQTGVVMDIDDDRYIPDEIVMG